VPPARRYLVIAGLMIAATLAPAAHAAAPLEPPVFADEFDGTSLDLTRWSHRASGPRNDGVLTPDAVSVGGGVLTITTYTEGGTHFSGMIGTQRNGTAGFEQAYGYFEARVRFDSSPGQWSSFWLQSPTIGSPLGDPAAAGVEMDIAEHRTHCVAAPAPTPPATCAPGNDISDRLQHALVWDGYGPDSKSAVRLSDPLAGLSDGSWHTYALRWTPTELEVFYDDAPIWSAPGPFSQRSQYIVLSSEVGAFFAGAIPPGGYGSRAASTTDMQVDYVRVWSFAPVNRAAPAIAGTPVAGQPLSCSPGAWSGDPAPGFAYAWLSDGAPIAGAAAPGYTVQAADEAHALACRVTATNTAGAATADSAALPIAVAPPPVARQAPLLPPPLTPVFVDRTAPLATLSGSRAQRLGRTAAVTITCADEACRATAAGSVRVPRVGRTRARTYVLATRSAAIARGGRVTLRLRLPARTRAAIRRAQRAHHHVVLQLRVAIADGAGNTRRLTRRIELRR
jgi:beta-glucanase (GH16 family)